MKISITNKTPQATQIEFVKFEDIYGNVLVMRGWR